MDKIAAAPDFDALVGKIGFVIDDIELMRKIQLTVLHEFGGMREATLMALATTLFNEIRYREQVQKAHAN